MQYDISNLLVWAFSLIIAGVVYLLPPRNRQIAGESEEMKYLKDTVEALELNILSTVELRRRLQQSVTTTRRESQSLRNKAKDIDHKLRNKPAYQIYALFLKSYLLSCKFKQHTFHMCRIQEDTGTCTVDIKPNVEMLQFKNDAERILQDIISDFPVTTPTIQKYVQSRNIRDHTHQIKRITEERSTSTLDIKSDIEIQQILESMQGTDTHNGRTWTGSALVVAHNSTKNMSLTASRQMLSSYLLLVSKRCMNYSDIVKRSWRNSNIDSHFIQENDTEWHTGNDN